MDAGTRSALLRYFNAGTAEGEQSILLETFVNFDGYADMVTPEPFNPRLLVGKKGCGKSAVVHFFAAVCEEHGLPALLLRPMDIDLSAAKDDAPVGETTRLAYDALLRAVAEKMGSLREGLLTPEQKVLRDEAVRAGLSNRDVVERLAAVLPGMTKAVTKVDLSSLIPQAPPSGRRRLENALKANLDSSGSGFFLFVDDTDQVAAPEKPGHLNRIWAFLLAARALSQKSRSLRVIVTLRDEVWRRLTRDKAGQRDQTDHFAPLVMRLDPSRAHIERIIQRRLQLAAERVGRGDSTSPYEPFFEGTHPRMPLSKQESSWDDLIVLRSRDRPRDAIQLVANLAKNASGPLITERDFEAVMKAFSEERATLIAQEVEAECPVTLEILRSLARLQFDRGSFKASALEIRDHLKKLPTVFGITLFGRTLHGDDDLDALELWKHLWDNGILNARVSDTSQKDGFRHIMPADDPALISRARWNEMQAMTWEVNPVYRDYLYAIRQEEERRVGLPPSRRR